MLRKILLSFAITHPITAKSNVNQFKNCVEILRNTINMPFKKKHAYLQSMKIPFPYPNMHMQYQTPHESLDNFESMGINYYDDDKSFIENWFDIVGIYNKKHHSLPIPIPNKKSKPTIKYNETV